MFECSDAQLFSTFTFVIIADDYLNDGSRLTNKKLFKLHDGGWGRVGMVCVAMVSVGMGIFFSTCERHQLKPKSHCMYILCFILFDIDSCLY